MVRYWLKQTLAALAFVTTAGLAGVSVAQDPDPQSLLQDMQRALVPVTAQLSRVHIAAHSDQPGGGSKTWDALVLRLRDDDGPHTAFSLEAPAEPKGAGILTAPHPHKPNLGLWLYAPEERRAVENSPLEADRQFLSTRFNFEDLGFTARDTQPPVLLGSDHRGQQTLWKVETRPIIDRYYSRMVTWIADDTRLPVKREYYDRAEKLWKVVDYRAQLVDGVPTLMAIELKDVQSRDVATWRVEAIAYVHEPLDQKILSPARLGDLPKHEFWSKLERVKQGTLPREN